MIEVQEAHELSLEDDYLAVVHFGNFLCPIGIERAIPTVPICVGPALKFDPPYHAFVKAFVLYAPNFASYSENFSFVPQVGCDSIFAVVFTDLIQISGGGNCWNRLRTHLSAEQQRQSKQ
jgi:hypothetical protein